MIRFMPVGTMTSASQDLHTVLCRRTGSVSGLLSTTAMVISHGWRACAGATLVGMASWGRPQCGLRARVEPSPGQLCTADIGMCADAPQGCRRAGCCAATAAPAERRACSLGACPLCAPTSRREPYSWPRPGHHSSGESANDPHRGAAQSGQEGPGAHDLYCTL
jgi:hypothetical protein